MAVPALSFGCTVPSVGGWTFAESLYQYLLWGCLGELEPACCLLSGKSRCQEALKMPCQEPVVCNNAAENVSSGPRNLLCLYLRTTRVLAFPTPKARKHLEGRRKRCAGFTFSSTTDEDCGQRHTQGQWTAVTAQRARQEDSIRAHIQKHTCSQRLRTQRHRQAPALHSRQALKHGNIYT